MWRGEEVGVGVSHPPPTFFICRHFRKFPRRSRHGKKILKEGKKQGKKHKKNKKTCTAVKSKNSFLVRLYYNHIYS